MPRMVYGRAPEQEKVTTELLPVESGHYKSCKSPLYASFTDLFLHFTSIILFQISVSLLRVSRSPDLVT